MDNAVELTEMTELAADDLHLVKTGANGFSPLLEKAVRGEIEEASKSNSEEIDEIQKLLTGSAAKSLCGDYDCVVCAPTLSKMPISDTLKERLTSASRDALPDSAFVFPKSRKYPIHDENHARNALSRVAGKGSKEQKVKAAVGAKFPGIDQAEKSPGIPKGSTKVPGTADALPTWPQPLATPHLGESEVSKIKTVDPSAGHGDPEKGPVGSGAAPKIPGAAGVVKPKESISGMTRKMFAYSTLAGFLERVEAQQEGRAIKEPWVAKPNPNAPGEEPVEPTLKEAVDKLSEVFKAIADGYDHDMIKSFQLSDFSTQSLTEARDQLTSFLSARPTTNTEASEIMIQMTKEELAKEIADGAKTAVGDALKAEGKQLRKAAKLLRRALKQTSNNKGEIGPDEMKGKVKAKRSADDVAIPGSGVTKNSGTAVSVEATIPPAAPEKVKKGKKSGLKKELRELREAVSKFGKRPVVGGPHLTGTPSGEGRQGEPVSKSAEDSQIENLQKELADLMKSTDPGAVQRIQNVSYQLTKLQLSQGHRLGQI